MKNPPPNFSRHYKIALTLYLADGSQAAAESIEIIRKQAQTLKEAEELKELKEPLRGLSRQIMMIQEQERKKISRELQDVMMGKRRRRLGLLGMRERVEMVDGTKTIPLLAMARR